MVDIEISEELLNVSAIVPWRNGSNYEGQAWKLLPSTSSPFTFRLIRASTVRACEHSQLL